MSADANDPAIGPGDPYPHQGGSNPYLESMQKRAIAMREFDAARFAAATNPDTGSFYRGTTTVIATDKEGWLVSMTPSGGWVPAVIAGHTGISMSQRMQSFVLDAAENPFNLPEPGKRPRATLTPSLAFRDGKPWMAFAVQGGDTQDQNLLQFFLNVVEFGMTVQEATEAANFTSYQMRSSFGEHLSQPGRLTLNDSIPSWVREELRRMGYKLEVEERTSGPTQRDLFRS
jgi:gamma-glutamyltranspeptidase/glutathione hydrolase